jgi:hypothetical protein
MHSYVNILRLITDTSCFLHREIRLSPTINILYLYLLERYRPILWVTCFGWTLLLEKMVDWKNLEEDMEDFVSQISSHLIKPSILWFRFWNVDENLSHTIYFMHADVVFICLPQRSIRIRSIFIFMF